MTTATLTDREREVLALIAAGDSGAEIGEKLYVAENTIKTHTKHLCAKLGARNRTHLVQVAHQLGLLGEPRDTAAAGQAPAEPAPPPAAPTAATETVKVTGPQLEVIALLAEGIELNLITGLTRQPLGDVHDTIWAACRALDAKDRTHLVAEAFRAGLLRVPGVEQLRAEVARLEHALTTARREARESRHAATDARNGKGAADTRAAELAAAAAAAEQLRAQLTELRKAHDKTRADLTAAQGRIGGLRSQLATAEISRDRALEEAAQLRAGRTPAQAAPTVLLSTGEGDELVAASTVQWCLDKLAGLARQARDGAAYGRGTPQLVDRAKTLAAAANAIDQAWQRRQLYRSGARRA